MMDRLELDDGRIEHPLELDGAKLGQALDGAIALGEAGEAPDDLIESADAAGGACPEPLPVVLVLQKRQGPGDKARDHAVQPECRPEAPQEPGHDRAKRHGRIIA